jgi:hypothetical protein
MNARHKLATAIVFGMGLASASANAATIADWTFETTAPTTAGPLAAEIGSGTALGHHSGTSVYSSPVGNGSSHSFSSTAWSVGDYYQFQVSTAGLGNLSVSWDQTSSNTGPRDFLFEYSTDGSNFTELFDYSVPANTSPNAWSSNPANYVAIATNTQDLSSITALNNAASVYFRLVDEDTTAANGLPVASGGTDRVDNFIVSANPVPLPAALWLLGSGLLGLGAARRRKSAGAASLA